MQHNISSKFGMIWKEDFLLHKLAVGIQDFDDLSRSIIMTGLSPVSYCTMSCRGNASYKEP